jgi:hypothetical protein
MGISSALRAVALGSSVVILLAFAMFVSDQSTSASGHQQSELSDEPAPSAAPAGTAAAQPAAPAAAEHHNAARRAVERADDFLLGPLRGIGGDGEWASHVVPALLALLLYGWGLLQLAHWIDVRTHRF